MNQIAIVVLGTAALLVHLAALLLATPLLVEPGMSGPVWRWPAVGWRAQLVEPFLRLSALAAKPPVRSDGASILSILAPVVALALTVAAAMLVPSFATGMLGSPLADLPLLLALLAAGRLVRLAAAADEGVAGPGLAAVSGTVDALLALPGLVLAVSVLFLSSGSTVLDTILSGQRGVASPVGLACAAAMALAALTAGGRDTALSQSLSGPDLALFRIENGLRRLVWINLVGGLAWPGSLAPVQSGPLHWMLALLAWLLRFVVAAVVLHLLAEQLQRTPVRRGLAGLSLLAALLAPILLLAGQGTP